MKDTRQEMSAQAALALEQNPNAAEDPKQAALTRRLAFIAECIQDDEAALLKALSVENKMERSPKRRKLNDDPDAGDAMTLLFWKAIQLEKMDSRVTDFKDLNFAKFVDLVDSLKVEFQTKEFDVEALQIFKETIKADIDTSEVKELLNEMAVDLQEYTVTKFEKKIGTSKKFANIV